MLGALAAGCGGKSIDIDGDSRSRGGSTASGGSTSNGGGSNGGTSSGGASSGGTSGAGTSGGGTSNGSSGSGSGGSSEVIDCTGAFGAPRTVLETARFSVASLTVSPDELELIYVASTTMSGEQGFYRARRASRAEAFSEPVALPELDAVCTRSIENRSGDLTFDGLGFYFACYEIQSPSAARLRVARRASLDAPFVVDPTPFGTVTGGPSVSRDELELFAAIAGEPAMRYVRSDASAPFGIGEPLLGFGTAPLLTPEIAPNGLDLFFAQTTLGPSHVLVTATRTEPHAAFGQLDLVLPEIMYEYFGSPALSKDCRSLYYVHTFSMPYLDRVEVISR
jgi:hypothetical protein